MHIKSLGLVNIQSHKETFVEFHPGFNVICGDSDSGKSTLLRTISWIYKDQPNGNVLENWDMKKKEHMAAEMVLCDPVTKEEISILKERIGSTSSYTLSNQTETLDVVKRNVPEEVLEVLNFSDLNFKGQHDPYLLKISGGQLAKMINDLVGVSVIDKSKKYENSKITRLEAECKNLEGDIEKKTQEIANLNYLDKLEEDICEIEILEEYKIEVEKGIYSLQKFSSEIKILKQNIEDNKEILKVAKEAEIINGLISWKNEIEVKRSRLEGLVTTIKNTREAIEYEKAWLEAEVPYSEIIQLQLNFSSVQTKKQNLETLVATIKSLKAKVQAAKENKQEKEKQYRKYLSENDTCPTCLRSLDENTINAMVNS